MEESQLHKERRAYPGQNRGHNQRSPSLPEPQPRRSALTPPKPPSRDYRSRILGNGASSVDKYHRPSQSAAPRPLEEIERSHHHLENGYYESPRSSIYSPNTEVWSLAEVSSASLATQNYELPALSPPRSPLREPLCAVSRIIILARVQILTFSCRCPCSRF